MNDSFQDALTFVLHWEGGLRDDPHDKGGRTNRGITQSVYNAWRASRGLAKQDVADIEDSEVRDIYQGGYWAPTGCPSLPQGLDLLTFDTAVNMGVGRSLRFLQAVVGCAVDGHYGPLTQAAAAACDQLLAKRAYCDHRKRFYQGIVASDPDQQEFLAGWLNRLAAVARAIGLKAYETPNPDAATLEVSSMAKVPDYGTDALTDIVDRETAP